MLVKVQVIAEREHSYQGKRGAVKQTILACLDITPGHPFINTFDYPLTEEERPKWRGTLAGKIITLALHDAKPDFGGRLRFKGAIIDTPKTS